MFKKGLVCPLGNLIIGNTILFDFLFIGVLKTNTINIPTDYKIIQEEMSTGINKDSMLDVQNALNNSSGFELINLDNTPSLIFGYRVGVVNAK